MSYESDVLIVSDIFAAESGRRESDWIALLSDALEIMGKETQNCSLSRVVLVCAITELRKLADWKEDSVYLAWSDKLEGYENGMVQ